MLLLLITNIIVRTSLLFIIIMTFLLVRQTVRDSESTILSIILSIVILSIFTIMAYIGISASFYDLLTITTSFNL